MQRRGDQERRSGPEEVEVNASADSEVTAEVVGVEVVILTQ